MAAALLAGVLFGGATVFLPIGIALSPGILALLVVAIASGGRNALMFGVLLILGGYFLFGKGFAYIGSYPVFVGEMGLALSILALLLGLASSQVTFRHVRFVPAIWGAGFLAWQLMVFIPNLQHHGLTALRDGAVWGYAAYGVAIAGLHIEGYGLLLVRFFKILVPVALIVWVVQFIFDILLDASVALPGSPVSFIHIRPDDVGPHIAAVGVFLALRLDRLPGKPWRAGTVATLWALWGLNWVLFGSSHRATMLGVLLAVLATMVLRPGSGLHKPILGAGVVIAALVLTDVSIPVGSRREISAEQLTANVTSTFGTGRANLESTKVWRLAWWATIVNYTFDGAYFWSGKGYGVSLARADNFEVATQEPGQPPNRSPHNVSMTILARSGVPGFLLWLGFVISLGISLARDALRSDLDSKDRDVALWIGAFLLAFLFVASFGVVLESPQGAIWFWCLVGFAMIRPGGKRQIGNSVAL